MLANRGKRVYTVLTALLAVYTLLSACYTGHSACRWFGDITKASNRKGISSLAPLYGDKTYGFEMRALDVLMQDDSRVLNIVEGAGDSYTHSSALSVYSGACTPLGWFVHEWMWHNDADPVSERAQTVSYFYTSGDEEYCRKFIKTYDIDYIFVGPVEVCKYPVNRNGFYRLGEVYAIDIWNDVEIALIKVDREGL